MRPFALRSSRDTRWVQVDSSQLLNLLAASAVFIALHRLVSGTPIRGRIVAGLSERVFLRAFALASALSLVWLVLAYAAASLRRRTNGCSSSARRFGCCSFRCSLQPCRWWYLA
jgi:hypothetical protein